MKRFLYFSAPWCGPCRQLGPTMDQVALNYPVRKINIDENPLLAQQYKIKNIPTVLVIDDDGDVLNSKTGAHPAQTYIDMYHQN
jgi:thioredoxin-like negative regulator of GroEL